MVVDMPCGMYALFVDDDKRDHNKLIILDIEIKTRCSKEQLPHVARKEHGKDQQAPHVAANSCMDFLDKC